MASPSSPQHEPTMEEILASIRKIISEDSNEQQPAAAPAPAPAPQPAPVAAAPAAEADVLELTQEVEEIPAPAPAPQPVPVAAAPRPADDVVFQTVDEPAPKPAYAPLHSSDELVTDKTRSAIDDALSGLDFEPQTHAAAPGPVAPIDGRTVEAVYERAIRETFDPVLRQWLNEQADVIVDRMKPAIREWMEDNLPAMLKSAVEAEVARAVRARTKR